MPTITNKSFVFYEVTQIKPTGKSITVYAGTGRAMAIVTPTFGRDQITIYGKLVPYVRPRN